MSNTGHADADSPSPASRERVPSDSEAGEGLKPTIPVGRARRLRRDATEAEKRLWSALRDKRLVGYRFRRQHPVGGFIVDFACTKHQLVVEADGGQHADNARDEYRTAILQKEGWRVLRFWNNDILANTEAVIEVILDTLANATPLTRPWALPAATLSRNAGEGQKGGTGRCQ